MTTEPNAVYFAPGDYAHLSRRFGVFLIDLSVVLLLAVGAMIPITFALTPESVLKSSDAAPTPEVVSPYAKKAFVGGLLLVGVPYHIALRRLRGGTLGYRLMGVRLVDATGQPPSWRALTKRFLLAAVGAPFWLAPLILSYLYCLKHPRRQTGHDFWSGTWVVKRKAQPAGPALVSYQSKLLGTWLLNYIDVEPYSPEQPTRERTDPQAEPVAAATQGE